MKGFKKLALVAAIAAPFSSVQALEAIDDAALSGMTGQAGVTIDLQTRVDIDSITWTDTAVDAAVDPDDIGGGSVIISDIAIGGHAEGSSLDDVRLTIDSGPSIALRDGTTTDENKSALLITVGSQSGGPVDLGLDVGAVTLGGWTKDNTDTVDVNEATNLLSNISLDITLAPQRIVIHEVDTTAHIEMSGYFRVDDGSLDVDVLGAKITGLKVGQIDFNEDGTVNTANGANGWTAGSYLADNYGLNVEGDATLAGPAVAVAGMAYYALDIETNNENQLVVGVDNFYADIAIADIELGGASVGSVGIDNLAITNTSLTVYGH